MTNTAQKYAAMTAARKEIIAKYNNAIIGHVVDVLENELKTLILKNELHPAIEFDQYRIRALIRNIADNDLKGYLEDIKDDITDNYAYVDEAKIDLIDSYIENIDESVNQYDVVDNYVRYPLIEDNLIKNLEAVKDELEANGFTLTPITAYKFKVAF